MTMSDPIADTLTRIRNGQRAHKQVVAVPYSKPHEGILDVLQREGYILGFEKEEVRTNISNILVTLKYHEEQPVIKTIKRISKPGRRVYSSVKDLPKVANGLGISVLSTPKGFLSDFEARQQNVGGEIICEVF